MVFDYTGYTAWRDYQVTFVLSVIYKFIGLWAKSDYLFCHDNTKIK